MDPFGTKEIRDRVLRAWTESPARFREDANAEEDLLLGGYRDRVFVELAQNAADADATDLRVELVDGVLMVANTGRPLTADGVGGLASLRASAKRSGDSVGHFGVGFAAVLAVSTEPSIVSTTGGVRFSHADTGVAVADIDGLAGELAARKGQVPVLRLPWPVDSEVPDGYTTEVRLPLRSDVDGAELLAAARVQAPDLLLALPKLRSITVGADTWTAERDDDGLVRIGSDEWRTHRVIGSLGDSQRGGLGVEEHGGYSVSWAVRVDADGAPIPETQDVLHAPTPSDERLSLPARLLATVPMDPSRRHVRDGAATDGVLAAAAAAYPDFLSLFAPVARLDLVPHRGLARSKVDEFLLDEVLRRCVAAPVLPSAAGSAVTPAAAVALEVASESLVAALSEVIDGLLPAEMAQRSHNGALSALGVRRIGLAEIADTVLGVSRPPDWWRALYAALAETVDLGADATELGALPVPLLDGRTLPGPRGVLLPEAELVDLLNSVLLDSVGEVSLPVVHPRAAHPLLIRLGARQAGRAELLETDDLRAAVRRSVEDAAAGLDTRELADVVLGLISDDDAVSTMDGSWVRALALPDTYGRYRRADELVLPDAALLAVLDDEVLDEGGPLGTLADEVVARHAREKLRAVGVLDGFTVLLDEQPVDADHGLADEREWWDSVAPQRVHAVRELDLVADDSWPEALTLLASGQDTWRALSEVDGYTGWWTARFATLGGLPPRQWRLAEATDLAGLFDPAPVSIAGDVLRAAGVRDRLVVADADDATDVLGRLADPRREIPDGVAMRAHEHLARAYRDGAFALSEVDAPESFRTASGVRDDAVVVDAPWLLHVLDPAEVVVVQDFSLVEPLAELLDLPVAAEALDIRVAAGGEAVDWSELAAVTATADLLGLPVPAGQVISHERLVVEVDDVEHAVPWCVADGILHAADSVEGLGSAFAWTAGCWADRHRITALLDDPTALALLR